MRKLFVLFLVLFTTALGYAQSEVSNDSIVLPPSTIRKYGDFMFDMGLMNMSTPALPKFNLLDTPFTPDYNKSLFPELRWTFGQEVSSSSVFGSGFYGPSLRWGESSYMQKATYRLNDNMKLNLYGEYDANGWRKKDPSTPFRNANDFRGAIEFKSNNFGIKFEVRRSNGSPYSVYW